MLPQQEPAPNEPEPCISLSQQAAACHGHNPHSAAATSALPPPCPVSKPHRPAHAVSLRHPAAILPPYAAIIGPPSPPKPHCAAPLPTEACHCAAQPGTSRRHAPHRRSPRPGRLLSAGEQHQGSRRRREPPGFRCRSCGHAAGAAPWPPAAATLPEAPHQPVGGEPGPADQPSSPLVSRESAEAVGACTGSLA